ncbi:MAG: ATP-binding protein [Bdellovibrionaceae bacterium]|nr:ATP-binding protein [Pseudobdellovibrionaceae bacterium]
MTIIIAELTTQIRAAEESPYININFSIFHNVSWYSKEHENNKIRLFNGYKRFLDLTIDLGDQPKRIVALVGPNGSGKSRVLDGILYKSSVVTVIGESGGKNFEYHSMNLVPNFNQSNLVLELESGEMFENYVRTTRISRGYAPSTAVSFRSPHKINFHFKIDNLQATPDIAINRFGASTTADVDSKMSENYKRLNAMVTAYQDKNDVPPSVAKLHILGELNQSIKRCLDLEISSVGNILANQGTLYFTKTDQSTKFEFNVLSSGEKEVVDLIVDLFLRKEKYQDSIFLFDEPELHINTSIQGKLLQEIDHLVHPSNQIWISTHSVGFIKALQDNFADSNKL